MSRNGGGGGGGQAVVSSELYNSLADSGLPDEELVSEFPVLM